MISLLRCVILLYLAPMLCFNGEFHIEGSYLAPFPFETHVFCTLVRFPWWLSLGLLSWLFPFLLLLWLVSVVFCFVFWVFGALAHVAPYNGGYLYALLS